jgi:hydroxyacylglutathione hydrolase
MLEIFPIPAFKDNYIWLARSGTHALVVDPGDAQPVDDFLARNGLTLVAILVTHHHPDHVGGLAALLATRTVPVYGPRGEAIPAVTHQVGEGDRVAVPALGVTFSVLEVPGHTRGHIAYYGAETLFCGDTLFACGCGRLFEGTPEQMHASLQKLAALPENTRVYCAHEYTLDNIRFARAVEPDNAALAARERQERSRRDAGRPTLPTTLALERSTNPFLRCTAPSVIAAASRHSGAPLSDPVRVFAAIRGWKNQF